MESRLLLNVIIRKGVAILELLTSEDQVLLVRRDTLVLDLGLDVADCARGFHFEKKSLPMRVLMKICMPPQRWRTRSERVWPSSSRLPGKIKCCWSGGMPSFVLNLGLDIVDRVGRLNLEGDHLIHRVLMKICMPAGRQRTRWRVNSFYIL